MLGGTDQFIHLVKHQTGINLHVDKRPLIYNRIRSRLTELEIDLNDYTQLCQKSEVEMQHLLDVITTNHTSWFREPDHFDDVIERIIPELLKSNPTNPKLRIWSAACSSGEEPYSLAIHILQHFPQSKHWDIRILSSDISQRVLNKATAGIYSESELEQLNKEQKQIGFTKQINNGVTTFHINSTIRSWVAFAQVNLIQPWRMHGPFDLILCRNVMIYFDEATRADLINKFAALMQANSTLFIGHTESIHNLKHPFILIKPSIYELS